MKNDTEDKTERVLSMYSRLKQGKVICKAEEANRYDVATRTIQRDISDIQCFLQNQNNETGEVQEIVYDRCLGGYRLETKAENRLKPKELLAICKVLLESRSLTKEEMFPIINKLLNTCNKEEEKRLVKDYIRNEMHHYTELQHHKKLLDRLWKLEKAVKQQYCIQITYQKLKNKELVTRKLKPVGIMFSEFYYYLIAFIKDMDKEKVQNDLFPAIYRIDRIGNIKILDEHFSVPYGERFEEGEFRKRIQFMYGGKLRKIRLKCNDQCLEAVLDRFPTAEIVKKEGDGYVVKAEVFGDGVDMWLKGQEENVEEIF